MDMLKSNMNEPMVQIVQDALQGALQEDKIEEMEIEQRKKNVVVHGGSLRNNDNESVNEPRMKAEMLNNFFSSVFTVENYTGMPLLDSFSGEKLVDIAVDTEVIKNKLRDIKVDKAAGDDNMVPNVLKAVYTEIVLSVAMIFRKSLDTGSVSRDWRMEICKCHTIVQEGQQTPSQQLSFSQSHEPDLQDSRICFQR